VTGGDPGPVDPMTGRARLGGHARKPQGTVAVAPRADLAAAVAEAAHEAIVIGHAVPLPDRDDGIFVAPDVVMLEAAANGRTVPRPLWTVYRPDGRTACVYQRLDGTAPPC
jgi:hypothetical protein